MAGSILWYDLETFGLEARLDRIAQFASIRTNENLEVIDEKKIYYCTPPLDYLPNPHSCLVHGITPNYASENGICEYNLARFVYEEACKSGTTMAGFNSLRFDDEFIRNLLYRNLYDPYEREYKNGNTRWDIIDLLRATHDLRPENIVWPTKENGRPNFSLSALAAANGIVNKSSHDAMHDVMATVELARFIKSRQPKLYDWYWTHRTRDSLRSLIDLHEKTPLLYCSAINTSPRGCTSIIVPLALDPENRNLLIALDLSYNPAEVLDNSVEELRQRVFAAAPEPRLPLTQIKLNRCPFLAPLNTLTGEAAKRLGLDVQASIKNAALIKTHHDLLQKMVAVYDLKEPEAERVDPELKIYSGGFFNDEDRANFTKVHFAIQKQGPMVAKQITARMKFADGRIGQLLRRIFARNFPDTLNNTEQKKWREFCASRLQFPPLPGSTDLATFEKTVNAMLERRDLPARDRGLLLELVSYKQDIEKATMNYLPL